MHKLMSALLLVLTVAGCPAEETASGPDPTDALVTDIMATDTLVTDITAVDVASPPDDPGADEDVPLTQDVEAEEDVPAKPEPCVPEGNFVVWSPACTADSSSVTELAAGSDAITALEMARLGDVILVAWGVGGTVMGRLVTAGGETLSSDLVIGGALGPVSGIAIMPNESGFAVAWSNGWLDDGAANTSMAVLDADGAELAAYDGLVPDYQLGRGGALGPSGYRIWGLRDTADGETQVRSAFLGRISTDGVLEGTHFIPAGLGFGYMRFHSNEQLLHMPFTRDDAEVGIRYFLGGLNQPGCGLPIDSKVTLGPGGGLVASDYLDDKPVWVAAGPGGCDESGTGRIFVHGTLFVETQEAPLSFGPAAVTELIGGSSEGVLIASARDDGIRGVLVSPQKLLVTLPLTLVPLPDETVLGLRGLATDNGWLLAWHGSGLDGTQRVALKHVCPAAAGP